MTRLLALIRREPAMVTGLVLAVIGVASSFGLGITDGQRDAIVAVVGAVLALLGSAVTRSKVTPVAPEHRAERGAVDLLYVAILALVVVAILVLVGVL